MIEHTPGPWFYVDVPYTPANQRLIAASPDLLTACQLLLDGADCSDWGEIGIDHPTPVAHQPGQTCPVCVARAALAKTRGESE